jgi:hypothetical protein
LHLEINSPLSEKVQTAIRLVSIHANFTRVFLRVPEAYVGQMGSHNLTLSKQHGTNYDHYNVGVFTLGNGKTFYVVCNNSTDFLIQLDSGEYVILGTSDINKLATSFSQHIYFFHLS